jgi:hypothetical protein
LQAIFGDIVAEGFEVGIADGIFFLERLDGTVAKPNGALGFVVVGRNAVAIPGVFNEPVHARDFGTGGQGRNAVRLGEALGVHISIGLDEGMLGVGEVIVVGIAAGEDAMLFQCFVIGGVVGRLHESDARIMEVRLARWRGGVTVSICSGQLKLWGVAPSMTLTRT